jgi:hypothetical protein
MEKTESYAKAKITGALKLLAKTWSSFARLDSREPALSEVEEVAVPT